MAEFNQDWPGLQSQFQYHRATQRNPVSITKRRELLASGEIEGSFIPILPLAWICLWSTDPGAVQNCLYLQQGFLASSIQHDLFIQHEKICFSYVKKIHRRVTWSVGKRIKKTLSPPFLQKTDGDKREVVTDATREKSTAKGLSRTSSPGPGGVEMRAGSVCEDGCSATKSHSVRFLAQRRPKSPPRTRWPIFEFYSKTIFRNGFRLAASGTQSSSPKRSQTQAIKFGVCCEL